MRKVVIAGMLGNGLEWYDFALYGQMATIIGHLFFPPGDPTVQLLATFGVFAVGFVFRPLGAVLFGYIGDTYGRKTSLVIAILMMAIPTGCIGLLPGYETIGVFAPLLLTLIRMLQGLSLGGAFAGSITYIVEHAPPGKRGLAGVASLVSLVLGFLLGSFVALLTVKLMPPEMFESWGWRLPFLFGVVIGLVGFYIRSACEESPTYEEAKQNGHISRTPVREAFSRHPFTMLRAFGVYMAVTMPFYLVSIYWISFTQKHLGRPADEAFTINFIIMFIMLIGMLVSAMLSDRFGRKSMMIPSLAVMFLLAYPVFQVMESREFWPILIAQGMFALLVGFYTGPVPALLVEMFPTSIRYTGMAISYNVAAALFGGTAPMVCEWLIRETGSTTAISWYIMFCVTASAIAIIRQRERFRERI